jgi:hypothetical protein
MSLFSILNNTSSSSTSSAANSTLQTILQQAGVDTASTTTATSGDSSTASTTLSSLLVSLQAKVAAAEGQDAKKDATTLAKELRTKLDAQYKEKGTKDASMGDFSGRSLAMIATNADGGFSNAEVAQAKSEMRERDRQTLISVMNAGPLTSSALATYGKSMLTARTSMSAEERAFRDAHPNLR